MLNCGRETVLDALRTEGGLTRTTRTETAADAASTDPATCWSDIFPLYYKLFTLLVGSSTAPLRIFQFPLVFFIFPLLSFHLPVFNGSFFSFLLFYKFARKARKAGNHRNPRQIAYTKTIFSFFFFLFSKNETRLFALERHTQYKLQLNFHKSFSSTFFFYLKF